jgi:hypothetical protein
MSLKYEPASESWVPKPETRFNPKPVFGFVSGEGSEFRFGFWVPDSGEESGAGRVGPPQTVKAMFWTWLSGKSPRNLFS